MVEANSVGENEKAIKSRNDFFDSIDNKLFHIIIDDGDHKPESQLKTFNNFVDKLHPNGVYIIEDIWDWDKHNKSCKCDITGLQFIQQNIPELEIINMNDRRGIYEDNILGVYCKNKLLYSHLFKKL